VSLLIAIPLWQSVHAAGQGSFDAIGLTLVAMLFSLAILEHLFLVIPLPFEALWKWGLRSRVAN
jgi:putative photosynthetic complex assembly protein 2